MQPAAMVLSSLALLLEGNSLAASPVHLFRTAASNELMGSNCIAVSATLGKGNAATFQVGDNYEAGADAGTNVLSSKVVPNGEEEKVRHFDKGDEGQESRTYGILSLLETLSKYGIIDILFGVGIFSVLWRFVAPMMPSNYSHLHTDAEPGPAATIGSGEVPCTLVIRIRNSGGSNLYIARAYFRAKQRRFCYLWLMRVATLLKVHPLASRILEKDAYELKFFGTGIAQLSDLETVVRPGHQNQVITFVPLSEPPSQEMLQKRSCGVLYIEYATQGSQGIHRVSL